MGEKIVWLNLQCRQGKNKYHLMIMFMLTFNECQVKVSLVGWIDIDCVLSVRPSVRPLQTFSQEFVGAIPPTF